MRPSMQLLDQPKRERITSAVIRVMEQTGVVLSEQHALELLHGAGAKINGGRVHVPQSLLEAALQTAPQTLELWDRNGDISLTLGAREVHFGAHADAPDILDPRTEKRRPCCEADVGRNAVLVDELPNMAFVTASGLVSDRNASVGDRVALAQCLRYSTKPVLAMPVTLDALKDCWEMVTIAVESEQTATERPPLVVYAEPVSPLVHPDESMAKVLFCAERRIPVVYSGYAAMGATAPQSPASVVVQLCAETLTGLVVHQLQNPGAPYIFGGMASVMDMKTTVFSYGAPEFQRGNALMAEMAHHFGLPNFGTAGTSDAQVFDGQAVMEATSSCLTAAMVGADLTHDVGLLGSASVVVPEMIVATDEIVAMVEHMLADVAVDEASLALDVLDQVGPGGEFVTHPHTMAHFREVWYPSLLFREGGRAWQNGVRTSFEERVRERTCMLLESDAPDRLETAALQALEEIICVAEDRNG